tara:strand:- start:381 stop:728 length:348 start_codon:yes stop_codon:yes gene_type:complete
MIIFNLLNDELLLEILTNLNLSELIIISKLNSRYKILTHEIIRIKSLKYGGIPGLKFDYIFTKIKNKRQNIIDNLSNPNSWNKSQLNLLRWSSVHMDAFGLYNLNNCDDIQIWLC